MLRSLANRTHHRFVRLPLLIACHPLSRNEFITTCASLRPGELVGPLAAAKRALRSLPRRIQALDAELKELMADLDGLTQAACLGLRQSYGIGIDGAAVVLAAVGDNPERIRSEAAYAAICGASALLPSSDTSRHHRLNRGGNRQANVTLHRIAVERLSWHEQTKAYAESCKGEGLSNKDIPRCFKRFIAREAFDLLMGKPPRRTAAT